MKTANIAFLMFPTALLAGVSSQEDLSAFSDRALFAGNTCSNAVTGLVVIDANDGSTVGQLGDDLIIGPDDAFTIRATTNECPSDFIAQVAWMHNDAMVGADDTPPYTLTNDGVVFPFVEGLNTLVATPVSEAMISGDSCAHNFTVTFESTTVPTSSPTLPPTSTPTTTPTASPTSTPTSPPTPSPSITFVPTFTPCECCEVTEEFNDVPADIETFEELLEFFELDPNTTIPSKDPAIQEWSSTSVDTFVCLEEEECPEEDGPEDDRQRSLRQLEKSLLHRELQGTGMDAFKRFLKKAARTISPKKIVACCSCGVGTLALEAICLANSGPGKAWNDFQSCLCDLIDGNAAWEFACGTCFEDLPVAVAARRFFGC